MKMIALVLVAVALLSMPALASEFYGAPADSSNVFMFDSATYSQPASSGYGAGDSQVYAGYATDKTAYYMSGSLSGSYLPNYYYGYSGYYSHYPYYYAYNGPFIYYYNSYPGYYSYYASPYAYYSDYSYFSYQGYPGYAQYSYSYHYDYDPPAAVSEPAASSGPGEPSPKLAWYAY